jgi:hypothetical protein
MSDDIVESSIGDAGPEPQESPVTSAESSAPPLGGGDSQQPSSPSQLQTPWDAFKRLPDFQGQDDRAIASRLYNAMEREKAASKALAQYQQVLPYAQEYLSNRREFEAWRQSQSSPQVQQAQQLQQAQPQAKAWWNPPQVRDSSKRYLIKDEDGREVIDPNAPITAREELYEYQQYKADFAKKFLENPEQALGPMVQDLAAKQAEQIIQERFQKQENEQFVSSIEEQNRDWLFDKQTGNVTPEGLLVHKYIEEARERGISGPQARWDYAIAMTEREMLAKAFDDQQSAYTNQIQQSARQFMDQQVAAPQPARPAPQPQPPQQDLAKQNMEYLRREAARNPSRSAGSASTDNRASKPKMTFEQMLREDAGSRGLI